MSSFLFDCWPRLCRGSMIDPSPPAQHITSNKSGRFLALAMGGLGKQWEWQSREEPVPYAERIRMHQEAKRAGKRHSLAMPCHHNHLTAPSTGRGADVCVACAALFRGSLSAGERLFHGTTCVVALSCVSLIATSTMGDRCRPPSAHSRAMQCSLPHRRM